MPTLISHVEQLADSIGPRPATTDTEARAADYIEDTFRGRGLEVERQEFDTPRSGSWPYVIYHLLTVAAAALALKWPVPALVLAIAAAILLSLDFDTRFSVARFLPKGPSQNIIARHVPRVRRGERLRRVVIIAHYDTAKTSIGSGPGCSSRAHTINLTVRLTTIAVPVAILIAMLPFAAKSEPWIGYVTLLLALLPLFALLAHLQHALLGKPVDGANDNASGVAALFGVMEAIVPEAPESSFRPRRRGAEEAYAAGVVPEDATLEYRQATRPLPDDAFGDVSWETTSLPAVRAEAAPARAGGDWADDDATGSLWDEQPASPAAAAALRAERSARPRPAPVPARWETRATDSWMGEDDDMPAGQERLSFGVEAEPAEVQDDDREPHGITSWLGLGRGYDVRKAGKKIGTWDKFSEEDEDEFGFKAGTAGELDVDATDVAAQIRRRVTESVDRSLAEKEIWFVATGADEAGGHGTRALLEAYGEELADAYIINLCSVGTGTLSFVADEGIGKLRRADRRLVMQAKRTARDNDLPIKGRSHRGQDTSITAALARGYKAITIKAFDINGRVPNRHQLSDTVETVREETIASAVSFVTALLREL